MIAAIILNYNSSQDCKECIADLKQQSVPIRIIVVDNCSREDDRNQLESFCQQTDCTFIQADSNRGYNAGNNIGMRHAAKTGCDYILISNPDMRYPDVDFISKLVSKADEDPDIAAIGGNISGLDGHPQSPMHRDGDWKSSFGWISDLLNTVFRRKRRQGFLDRPDQSHYCKKLMGSCLMIRKDYIESIGFFDEEVFLYCEEAILSRQIERDGKKMYYLNDAKCVHAHKSSEKGDPGRRFKNWRHSRFYYIEKYSGDSRMGRTIAKASMSLYVMTFLAMHNINKAIKTIKH